MLKNFDVPLLNYKKVQVKDGSGPDASLLTLADVAIHAVSAACPNDHELSERARIKLHSLAGRLADGGEREYTEAELKQIVARASKNCETLTYGRLAEFLTPEAITDAEKP